MTEDRPYMTLDEAAQHVGIKRSSIYNYLKDLKIKTHKFRRDRRAYLSPGQVEQLKAYKESPAWKRPEDEHEE